LDAPFEALIDVWQRLRLSLKQQAQASAISSMALSSAIEPDASLGARMNRGVPISARTAIFATDVAGQRDNTETSDRRLLQADRVVTQELGVRRMIFATLVVRPPPPDAPLPGVRH
jgi:hypothetical protein